MAAPANHFLLSAPVPAGMIWHLRNTGFSAELTPARYLLLCTVLEDEGRHDELGMIDSFTIE